MSFAPFAILIPAENNGVIERKVGEDACTSRMTGYVIVSVRSSVVFALAQSAREGLHIYLKLKIEVLKEVPVKVVECTAQSTRSTERQLLPVKPRPSILAAPSFCPCLSI